MSSEPEASGQFLIMPMLFLLAFEELNSFGCSEGSQSLQSSRQLCNFQKLDKLDSVHFLIQLLYHIQLPKCKSFDVITAILTSLPQT